MERLGPAEEQTDQIPRLEARRARQDRAPRPVRTDVGILRSRAMRRFLPRSDNCKYGDERHDREECDEHPPSAQAANERPGHVEQFEEPSHYSEG